MTKTAALNDDLSQKMVELAFDILTGGKPSERQKRKPLQLTASQKQIGERVAEINALTMSRSRNDAERLSKLERIIVLATEARSIMIADAA